MKTTLDGLLDRRVTLEQPADGYRIAVDTILLAAAVPARARETALDLGCGVGGVMLALAYRVPGLGITGIEIQSDLADLCHRNIERNRMTDRLKVIQGDVTARTRDEGQGTNSLFPRLLPPSSFDHVLMNPPYHDEARHDVSPDAARRAANTEKSGDLALWIGTAARALKSSGILTLIHRADRLEDIQRLLSDHFGAIEILPILRTPGAAPKRIILRAHKGNNAPPRQAKPLILHRTEGDYTDAAEAILRRAEALDFAL